MSIHRKLRVLELICSRRAGLEKVENETPNRKFQASENNDTFEGEFDEDFCESPDFSKDPHDPMDPDTYGPGNEDLVEKLFKIDESKIDHSMFRSAFIGIFEENVKSADILKGYYKELSNFSVLINRIFLDFEIEF